jgi:acyl-CoA synthetase (NDP forming)/GNAT superfamily N-acetyltransferase
MTALEITLDDVDALRADGKIIHVRDVGPADLSEIERLHARASDRSMYLRFFTLNRACAQQYIAKIAEAPSHDHHALGAFVHGRLVGVAAFERVDETSAEFALLVADDLQHQGVGTLLLEHLAASARGAGITRFVAEVLSENSLMLHTARDLGFASTTSVDHGTVDVEMQLAPGTRTVDAIGSRDQTAGSASLQPLLAPRSVVVIGAGNRPGSVGHEVLRNILAGGFTGDVQVVNPNQSEVLGVPSVPSPMDLATVPDLAVLAVPAAKVASVIAECGKRGVRAAIILGAGFAESGPDGKRLQDDVLAVAREHGIRLVGPNCIGVVNTDPAVRLDATFAVLARRPGRLAVLAQSGAFGVALMTAADEIGLGVSQFVSVGNKSDVGGNDLMLAWAADPRTTVIGMYLESIGDPLRFARIARHVTRTKPIIAVKSGRTEAGRKGAASHTAAAASPEVAIDALFRGSGVIRVRTVQEMLDTARVLADQPLPAGPRIAIVGNSGGPEILAADAASDAGLVIAELDEPVRALLRDAGAPVQNPIDLGAAIQPDAVLRVLNALHASSEVDAVLTVFTDIAVTEASEIRAVVETVAAASGKPTVAVQVGKPSSTHELTGTPYSLPVFTFPEPAAAALGNAYLYTQLRDRPRCADTRPAGTNRATGRALVTSALAENLEWLGAEDIALLLKQYGVAGCPQRVVRTADEAATAAAEFGYPVAIKLAEAGVHKTELGGVRLGLRDELEVRVTVADLTQNGETPTKLLVQPMITGGTELIIGAVHDQHFGPLVMLGAGGVLTDVLGDQTFRLAPLTDDDAEEMIDDLRSARLLDGYRGSQPVSRAAIRNFLVRIATMVEDIPEIAELDLNPIVCRGADLLAVDARIRIAPAPYHPDPLVRQLRGPAGSARSV